MIIAVNKPSGPTSFDIVQMVRSVTGEKKVGHAGTLDPFAEGVLVLGIGRVSTRQLGRISGTDKDYLATLRLGTATSTGDVEGLITEEAPVPHLTHDKIKTILRMFTGKQKQIPPMFSAKKVKGTRLYKLARQNLEVQRAPVEIVIYKLKLLDYANDEITFSLTCSKGTYIRQLGMDIAKALGTMGHLTTLVRTRVGDYTLDNAIPLVDIDKLCSFTEA
ncbi:MAG: tRNA pseudouridine(55) synthase TruB [Fidelibacterota bacterium]